MPTVIKNELEKNMKQIPKFLQELLEKQYGADITKTIIKGYLNKRTVTLRVNTIKSDIETIEKEFRKEKIEYDRVEWNKEAFILKNANEKVIQDMNIYKEGKIYLQSLSSMLPPIILEPKEGKDILDMAAAPGGKTTQMAAIANNKAHITACEKNKIRSERLKYNIAKQGASCVYVMEKDARYIDDFFSFDQILLDAPCSGSGTLNLNNNDLEKVFTEKLIKKSSSTQVELLKKALNLLKKGEEMIYSTCSILEGENEDIIINAIKNKTIDIVPIKFQGMETLPLLPSKIDGTICICPNDLYEGFFVAKLIKR